MAIRTALLNGNNITRDTDFSKYIESVSEPGVIDGLEVTSTKVGIGKAWVLCERTNGDTIYALVYNTSEVTISGNGDVYIQVNQTYIDNGELANEDGTGIATISVGTMPSKNALKLATISSGTVTDARNMIKKLDEFNTEVESIFEQLSDLDERVEHLEEAGAIDHLEESGVVGELYTLSDKLFKQYAPKLADCTLEANVGDVADNTQVHIQAIGSGVASNTLKLKVKKSGAPTTALYVEVRKGIQVTVTENEEAYWYGDSSNIIATGNLAYTNFSSDFAEVTFTLNNEFGATKGEILDIVVYQASNTVNASNYYVLACDSTQYSEAFSYVSVNGVTRTRSKLMPYVLSNGFLQSLLCKAKDESDSIEITVNKTVGTIPQGDIRGGSGGDKIFTRLATSTGTFTTTIEIDGSSSASGKLYVLVNGVYTREDITKGSTKTLTFSCTIGDIITFGISNMNNNSYYLENKTASDIIQTKIFLSMPLTAIKLLPKNLKTIGDLGVGTLYGRHTDGKYYGGIVTGTSTVAFTGEITPGNFVGYLTININDTIVKVPYYN